MTVPCQGTIIYMVASVISTQAYAKHNASVTSQCGCPQLELKMYYVVLSLNKFIFNVQH